MKIDEVNAQLKELDQPSTSDRFVFKKGKNLLFVSTFALTSFLLVSCILVDYVYCCTVNCKALDSSTSTMWAYYFNFVNPFFQNLSKANPDVGFFSQLSAQAGIWLFIVALSFFVMKINGNSPRLKSSLLDSLRLCVVTLFLFEIGLYFLCPAWRTVHVSNLQNGTILVFVSNEDLLFFSGIIVVLSILSKLVNSAGQKLWSKWIMFEITRKKS